MTQPSWAVEFAALKEEVAVLRREVRAHLGVWGLRDLVDEAQLCVSELVANVITHVGVGTPTKLALQLNGPSLRIEIHDPDTRALPKVVAANFESEGGRGMALVGAVADRWGVQLDADGKVTWCELGTGLPPVSGHDGCLRMTQVETVIGLYGDHGAGSGSRTGRLGVTEGEEAAISVITDLLHWLSAHGRDGDDVLDRAQMRFEAEVFEGSW
ncbi:MULTISPECIES: ATP-binding protein [Streptomyces violaceoruber group]|uniref:ATP-binding protein n=1 Tax=Streptomyces violaceoruber group TaxID=2867121 RepID=UPI002E363FCD|nr:ATP-binding protein [Streptomyces anthocyanicus]